MSTQIESFLQQDLIGHTRYGPAYRKQNSLVSKVTALNNVYKDMWEGPTAQYVFPTAGMQMTVASSNAADAAAGTGVRTVLIHYLDSQYNEQSEVVTLNGVTGVNTVATNILRVNGLHAMSVGSGTVSAGNISLTNTGATVTYAYIVAGNNFARHGIFTVPAGKTAYFSQWQASAGAAAVGHQTQITLQATCHHGVLAPGVFMVQDEVSVQDGGSEIYLPVPIIVPATGDVVIRAISDVGTAAVVAFAAARGWVE